MCSSIVDMRQTLQGAMQTPSWWVWNSQQSVVTSGLGPDFPWNPRQQGPVEPQILLPSCVQSSYQFLPSDFGRSLVIEFPHQIHEPLSEINVKRGWEELLSLSLCRGWLWRCSAKQAGDSHYNSIYVVHLYLIYLNQTDQCRNSQITPINASTTRNS